MYYQYGEEEEEMIYRQVAARSVLRRHAVEKGKSNQCSSQRSTDTYLKGNVSLSVNSQGAVHFLYSPPRPFHGQ